MLPLFAATNNQINSPNTIDYTSQISSQATDGRQRYNRIDRNSDPAGQITKPVCNWRIFSQVSGLSLFVWFISIYFFYRRSNKRDRRLTSGSTTSGEQ
jgi:hypothetical protein